MSETKWTKGPWVYFQGNDGTYPTVDSVRYARTIVVYRGNFTSVDEANANLIAAAPDLYEALDRILENYKHNNRKGIGIGPIVRANAALAKARGESCDK